MKRQAIPSLILLLIGCVPPQPELTLADPRWDPRVLVTPAQLLPPSFAVADAAAAIRKAKDLCRPKPGDRNILGADRESLYRTSLDKPWMARVVGLGDAMHWQVAGGPLRGTDDMPYCREFTATIDPATGRIQCDECALMI